MADIRIQKQIRIPGLITEKGARKRFEAMALNKLAEWVKKWPQEPVVGEQSVTRAELYGIGQNLVDIADMRPLVAVAAGYTKDGQFYTVITGQAVIRCTSSLADIAHYNVANNPGSLTFLRRPSTCSWRDGELVPDTMIQWPDRREVADYGR